MGSCVIKKSLKTNRNQNQTNYLKQEEKDGQNDAATDHHPHPLRPLRDAPGDRHHHPLHHPHLLHHPHRPLRDAPSHHHPHLLPTLQNARGSVSSLRTFWHANFLQIVSILPLNNLTF